jgi:hypothetical protein
MWNALAYKAIKLVCLNFFDNTQLFLGGPSNCTSSTDVHAQMQPMLNYWEAALHATGGALAHEKSHWCLVDFKWENGKCAIATSPTCLVTSPFPMALTVPHPHSPLGSH